MSSRIVFASLPSAVGALVLAAGAAALVACATDNGDAVHGPQFGPTPERPDGAADGSPDPDGGPGPGTDGGGSDAAADGSPASCPSGTVAVLAGGDTSLTGAVQIQGGPWTGAAIASGAAKSNPALVAFGAGFVGLTRGASDALQSVTYGTSFGAAAPLGALTTLGAPALAVVGTSAQAVLLSGAPDTNKFFRVQNTGTSWSNGGDPVMVGAVQSFGPSAGTVAAAGTELVFAQAGDDDGLYTQKWDGAAWSAGTAIVGAGTLKTAPPALVGVDGTYDLVLLYADKSVPHVIGYATRNAATKAWSTAQITQANAQTAEQMSVARIAPSVLLVTFRGNNGRPYVMTGTLGAASITWSVPVALLADTSTVEAAPSVAKGVCGDDAIAVFSSGVQVKATRYRGATWSAPETVTGASGSRVSVATR